MVPTPAVEQRNWRMLGAGASVSIGIGYVAIIALYVPMGARPSGADAWLTSLSAHQPSWGWIIALSVLTDLLFLPLAAALYCVLRQFGSVLAALSAGAIVLFVVLDLPLTWMNYAALAGFAAEWNAAAGGAARDALLSAARYPVAIIESNLLFTYNSLTLAIGIGLAGLLMWRGAFGRWTAVLGIATGLLGVIAVAGPLFIPSLSATIIVVSVMTTAWLLMVGYGLLRGTRPQASAP